MTSSPRGPVVVGIDGSDEANDAARYGAREARRRQVPLRLVYAYQPLTLWGPVTALGDDYGWERTWVDGVLAKVADSIAADHPGLSVQSDVCAGGAAGTLVAESRTASLVVVGTRAAGGFAGHLRGSVAVQVAAHSSAPVIALRRGAGPDDNRPVVVGLDGSEGSLNTMSFAVEQALARQAELHAVFVWSAVAIHDLDPITTAQFDYDNEQEKALRLLTEATAGWLDQYPDLTITRRTIHDIDPVQALSSLSETAGLVVVGARGSGGFLGLRIGSTVDGLIRHAHSPVAVVPIS